MRGQNTIVINGKMYDAITGLPVGAPDKPVSSSVVVKPQSAKTFSDIGPRREHTPVHSSSKRVHRTTQKSTTLRRDVLKKPVASAAHVGTMRRKVSAGHVQKSAMISKFAAHPAPIRQSEPTQVSTVQAPVMSSQIKRAHELAAKKHVAAPKPALSSRALKEQLIAEKLAETPKKEAKKSRSLFSAQPRVASVIAGCFALVVLGGYLTYLNMPNLSVRVAASQAGVAAKFPDYRPDGYRFDGPIAFVNGEVSIKFKANGGQGGYTIREQNSSWDSQAVYDNLVSKKSDGSHITNSQGGLTVYTYKNNAAWVNGGILYTVEGEAPLSNEQLLRIAGSM